MSEFKREKRYQVTKLSNPNWNGSCVVVEDDWPEYEIVWNMITDRVNGDPYFFDELQATIEQQAAKIAELREACIAAESAFITQVDADYNNVVHAAVLKLKQVLISTESNWLDEHDAKVRREVLLTASAELYRSVEWDQVEHRWLADWERVRRMAEQPESN